MTGHASARQARAGAKRVLDNAAEAAEPQAKEPRLDACGNPAALLATFRNGDAGLAAVGPGRDPGWAGTPFVAAPAALGACGTLRPVAVGAAEPNSNSDSNPPAGQASSLANQDAQYVGELSSTYALIAKDRDIDATQQMRARIVEGSPVALPAASGCLEGILAAAALLRPGEGDCEAGLSSVAMLAVPDAGSDLRPAAGEVAAQVARVSAPLAVHQPGSSGSRQPPRPAAALPLGAQQPVPLPNPRPALSPGPARGGASIGGGGSKDALSVLMANARAPAPAVAPGPAGLGSGQQGAGRGRGGAWRHALRDYVQNPDRCACQGCAFIPTLVRLCNCNTYKVKLHIGYVQQHKNTITLMLLLRTHTSASTPQTRPAAPARPTAGWCGLCLLYKGDSRQLANRAGQLCLQCIFGRSPSSIGHATCCTKRVNQGQLAAARVQTPTHWQMLPSRQVGSPSRQ